MISYSNPSMKIGRLSVCSILDVKCPNSFNTLSRGLLRAKRAPTLPKSKPALALNAYRDEHSGLLAQIVGQRAGINIDQCQDSEGIDC